MKESNLTQRNYDDYLSENETKRLHAIEKDTIHAYLRVQKLILDILGKCDDLLCVSTLKLVNIHFAIQYQRLQFWAHRTNAHKKLVKNQLTEESHGVVVELIAEADRVARGAENESMEKLELAVTEARRAAQSESKLKLWGVWHKPSKVSRKIVLTFTKESLNDLVGLILLLFIAVTLIRFVPLVSAVYELKGEKRTKYMIGFELKKHVRG